MKRLSGATLRSIGAEIRRRRHAAGRSIEQLAELAGLHKNYLGRVELGQVDVSVSALWSIAFALDCDLADLLPSAKHGLTPEILAAAHLLAEADPQVRQVVVTLLTRVPAGPPRRRGSSGA